MLELNKISVIRGGVMVLHEVDLTIRKGEIHAVLGRNGAGKTTLVDTTMGLLVPQSGTIHLENEDITGLRPDEIVDKGIAVVPEGRRLFPTLTVRENLSIGARRSRWFWKAPPAQVLDEIWTLFPDLKRFEHNVVGGLSGGQRQMVALGRALISKPKVLLLDEPSFGLSPQMVEATITQVQRLAALGLAVLLVEQSIDVVVEVANRATLLNEGRIVASGEPHQVVASEVAFAALFGSSQTPDASAAHRA